MQTVGTPLAIITALFVLLTYLLWHSRSPDLALRARMQEAQQRFELHDTALTRNVLLARAGLLAQYDSMAQAIRDLSQTLDVVRLGSTAASGEAPALLAPQVEALTAAVLHKATLVEYFTSDNAVLRNSLMYLIYGGQRLRTQAMAAGNTSVAATVGALSHAVLRFLQSPQPDVGEEILAVLEQWPSSPPFQQELATLAAHGRLIVEILPQVDTLLRQLMAAPTTWHAQALQQVAQQYYSQVDAQAQCARVLLSVAALILLSYWLYLFVQLWTARQHLAAQAREQEIQLIQANKMTFLGTLVSCVAHEVNNPNQLVMVNVPMLASAWQDARPILDAYRQDYGDFLLGGLPYTEMREMIPALVHDVYDGAQRIERIVNDLRDFARPRAHGIQAPFSINQAVQRALRLLRHLIQQKTTHCCVALGEDVPLLCGTPQHVEQVIVNLVVNALEALPDPSHGVTIATAFAPSEHGVVLTVQDEGVGIQPEHLAHLCEPFFTTKHGSGGTGLGLAIAAALVHAHGGQLTFTSTLGQGTCARVTLPCEPKAALFPECAEALVPASERSAII